MDQRKLMDNANTITDMAKVSYEFHLHSNDTLITVTITICDGGAHELRNTVFPTFMCSPQSK